MARTRTQIARKHSTGVSSTSGVPHADRQRPNGSLVVIAAAVASLFLFWYFHLLTLGQMTQLSGGLAMPDMMIGGYDTDYADRLREAMDDDARGQLSYLHRTAGTLFPLIFAFAWLLLVQLNTGRRRLRWLLWSPVILFVVVDLWENVAIDAMLAGTGDVLPASTLTVLRWALLALSLVAGAVSVFLPRTLRTAGANPGTKSG
ncbi:hypothetical protein [Arthrobacter sp. Ld5]|uniref:hypothetical protein n=1 Tax=Arthrobacter sp. Ld5 TaxID=649152 RepID=UPI003EC13CD8